MNERTNERNDQSQEKCFQRQTNRKRKPFCLLFAHLLQCAPFWWWWGRGMHIHGPFYTTEGDVTFSPPPPPLP
jgi:hypothetical protein